MADLSPQSLDQTHKDIGNDTFVLSSDGTPLRFTPQEKKFLIALDQSHDLKRAAEAVGKPEEWARAFFKRPKIHEWTTLVAQQHAAKSGMTVHWFRSMLLAIVKGEERYWEGECGTCHVKQKSWLVPDDSKGVFTSPCLACEQPVLMTEIVRPIRIDRQQMVALQELGNRIDPKIERIAHEFTDESFIFKAQE